MELILDVNMTDKAFKTFKYDLLKAAMKKSACDEGIEYHLLSTTPQEWLDNCGKYLGWLSKNGIDITLEGFVYCEGGLDLEGYELPLPEGFTHCEGHLDIESYKHPLPNTFTYCGGDLSLYYYNHSLPIGFKYNVKKNY